MNRLKGAVKLILLLLVIQTFSVGASAANTISGRVTDSSGNPIQGIIVRTDTVEPDYTNSLGGSAYTDENGEYAFTVENSVYYLEFVDVNRFNSFAPVTYFDRWYGNGQNDGNSPPDYSDNRQEIVVQDNDLTNMNVVMTRASTAAGTIQFDGVDVVDRLTVRAYHTPYEPNDWVSLNYGIGSDVVTGEGERAWRLNDIPAGTYRICASYYDAQDSLNSLFDCYGGDSIEEAADVQIGTEVDLTNFVITMESEPTPPHRITGVIYSSTGRPIPNTRVQTWPTDGAFSGFHTTTDENGAYTLFINPGTYTIQLNDRWHDRFEQVISVDDTDLNNFDVTLSHRPGIIGEVVAEDGRPFLSVEAMLYEWVASTENDEGGYWFPVTGGVGENSYGSGDPTPTTSIIYFIGEPFYTVASQSGIYRVCAWITYERDPWERTRRCYGGSSPATGTDVTLTTDQLLENIDIPISDAPTGHFTGRVTNSDGDGIAGVNVTLGYNDPWNESGWYTTIEADSDGTYTADILPGMYIVSFYDKTGEYISERYDEQIDQTVYIDRVGEILHPYTEFEPLIITAGETITINETLASAAIISGTVTLSDPQRIVGGGVYLNREEGDSYYVTSTGTGIGTDGTYQLTGIVSGTYRLCYFVRTVDYENSQCYGHVIDVEDTPDITVAEGERITIDFEMDLDTASVLYLPGEPVPLVPLTEEEIVGRIYLPFINH